MKKFLISLIALLVFAFPFKAYAEDSIPTVTKFSVAKDKVVTHNPYFAYGEEVEIAGTVTGDTYVAGGKVDISGKINGDLLVTGGTITISGEVKEDLRVLGGEVTLTGRVGKNVSVAGGRIIIDEDAVIVGSFVSAGGEITINGPVNDNVDIAGGNVILNSKVTKDFDVVAGQISLGEKANVLGKFEYWSDVKPTIAQTAVIKGQVIEHAAPVHIDKEKTDWNKAKANMGGINAGARVLGTLSLLLIGFLMIKLSKKFMSGAAEVVNSSFWKSMGIGFAVLFLTPIAFVVLLMTIIGVPLAFITILGYIILSYLAKIFVIYALGVKVLPNKSAYLSFSLALLVYAIVVAIPVFGGIINFVVLMLGLGAFVIAKKETLQVLNK